MKKYISVLLAVLVFVLGMMTRNGLAAGATRHKVTDVDGTVTVMELPGLDLQSYAKYNKDIQQAVKKDLIPESTISKHVLWNTKPQRILAKAIPGTTIIVSPVETNFVFDKEQTLSYYISRKNFKITNSGISLITKDDGHWYFLPIDPPNRGRQASRFKLPYTKDVDMICAQWRTAPLFLSKERQMKFKEFKNFVRTEYYIFTSDEAFKKAYKIWTGKTITGPIGSAPATKNETKKTESKKTTDKKTGAKKSTEGANKKDYADTGAEQGDNADANADDGDDLPATDVGKAAAAVGTALGGALLGAAGGAFGGAAGSAAGGAAGSAGGGYGPSEGGYGPEEGGYGPEEGGYGPDEGGYGPEEGGYGPEEGGYGPEEGGYGPPEGGYGPPEGFGNLEDAGVESNETGDDFEDTGAETEEPDDEFEDSGDEGEDPGDEGEDSGDEGEDSGDEGEDPGDEGEDSGDEGEDSGDEGEDSGDEGEDPGDEGEDSGDEGEDSGDEGEDSGDEFEDSGDEGEDSGDEGEDSGNEDEDAGDESEDSDDEGEDSDDDHEDAGEERDESDDDYENADEERDETADDFEDVDEERDESEDDFEDAGEESEETEDDFEDAVSDSGDVSEDGEQTEAMETAEEEPADGDKTMEAPPDNMSVGDDGSIRITTPDGETMVYTPNEDGSYNIPTKTESGLKVVDSDRNEIEPGQTVSAEDVQYTAQWFKDHEEEQRAERAAEDARQQEERDRLAAENAAWQAEQSRINNQLSRVQEELAEDRRRLKQEELIHDARWNYADGDESLSKEDLKKLIRKKQFGEQIKGALKEGESHELDVKIVNYEEAKFYTDQAVNAYGMLTHDPVLPTLYNAGSNYGGTMAEARAFNKDRWEAFKKASRDTAADLAANYAESKNLHIIGNVASNIYKQVNDNQYYGRDTWENVDEAGKRGVLIGLIGKGSSWAIGKSKGTFLGTELGGPDYSNAWKSLNFSSGSNLKIKLGSPGMDIPGGKVNTDVEIGGMRQTSIAERRMGEGLFKSNIPDAPTGRPNIDTPSAKTNIPDAPTGRPNIDTPSAKTNIPDAPTGRPNIDTPSAKTNIPDAPSGRPNVSEPPTGVSRTGVNTDGDAGVKPITPGDGSTGTTNQRTFEEGNTGSSNRKPFEDGNTGSANRKPVEDGNTGSANRKPVEDGNTGSTNRKPVDDGNSGSANRKPVDDGNSGSTNRKPVEDGNSGSTSRKPVEDGNTGSANRKPVDDGNTGSVNRKPVEDGNSGGVNRKPVDDGNSGSANRKPVDDGNSGSANRKPIDDGNNGSANRKPVDDGNSGSANRKPVDDGNSGSANRKPVDDGNSGSANRKPVDDGNTGSPTKPKPGDGNIDSTKPKTGGAESKKTSIAERRLGKGTSKTNQSEADIKQQISEDLQGQRAMNEVRKLYKISEKMAAIEKANPKGYQNDSEYQKLSEQFDSQARTVRENKLSIQRMNLLQGKTGTDLRTRYNMSDISYEQKVLKARNESLAEEYGLNPDQIGDFNVTSKRIEDKLAGGKAGNDTDTSPNVKVLSAGENDRIKTVDFTQVDGDHHLARAIYKVEHGRYPQTAAEYGEALRLKQMRDFTNVSVRPTDTYEYRHNPDAYMGSSKGDVNKVLHPETYGTPEKGTGVYNEMTAIHKQGAPLERHHQQYAEAQRLQKQLDTDTTLSAAERTDLGKRIKSLEKESANNHLESVRTTAKEFNVISNINDVNMKKGLKDGLSKEARQIGEWANKVANGEMDPGEYKSRVEEAFGSEENALKIVARGFRDTNL